MNVKRCRKVLVAIAVIVVSISVVGCGESNVKVDSKEGQFEYSSMNVIVGSVKVRPEKDKTGGRISKSVTLDDFSLSLEGCDVLSSSFPSSVDLNGTSSVVSFTATLADNCNAYHGTVHAQQTTVLEKDGITTTDSSSFSAPIKTDQTPKDIVGQYSFSVVADPAKTYFDFDIKSTVSKSGGLTSDAIESIKIVSNTPDKVLFNASGGSNETHASMARSVTIDTSNLQDTATMEPGKSSLISAKALAVGKASVTLYFNILDDSGISFMQEVEKNITVTVYNPEDIYSLYTEGYNQNQEQYKDFNFSVSILKEDREIPSDQVEYFTLKSSNPEVLKFGEGGDLTSRIESSDASIKTNVRVLNQGNAKIIAEYTVVDKDTGLTVTKTKAYSFIVDATYVEDREIRISGQSLVFKDATIKQNYRVINLDINDTDNSITKTVIKNESSDIVALAINGQNCSPSCTATAGFSKEGILEITGKHVGNATITIKSYVGTKEVVSTQSAVSVSTGNAALMKFDYAGTSYESPYFIDTFVASVSAQGGIADQVQAFVINNPVVYDQNGQNGWIFRTKDGRYYLDDSTTDLSGVEVQKDTLIVLPNESMAEGYYAGHWGILEVDVDGVEDMDGVTHNGVLRIEPMNKDGVPDINASGLSYIIGNQERYNVCDDKMSFATIGAIEIKEGKAYIQVEYEPYLSAREIALAANTKSGLNFGGGQIVYLHGGDVESTTTPVCEEQICRAFIRLNFTDSQTYVKNTHITSGFESEAGSVEFTRGNMTDCNGNIAITMLNSNEGNSTDPVWTPSTATWNGSLMVEGF